MRTRLTVLLVLGWLWLADIPGRLWRTRHNDSGEGLPYAVIVVGAVAIAGAILYVVRQKAQTVTNNICTNADPTTCR